MGPRFLIALGLSATACTTEGLSEQDQRDDIDDSDPATEKSSMDGYTGADYDVRALPPRLRTGDRIRNGGAAALVPAPGEAVYAEMLSIEGAETLSIEVDDDGTAHVSVDDDSGADEGAEATAAAAAPAPGPCDDDSHNIGNFTWTEPVEFTFKASSTPDKMPVAFAENAIVNGGLNIVNAHNGCGRADHVSAKIHYNGRDPRGTNIPADGVCGKHDGHSTVAFGDFTIEIHDRTVLGITCIWKRKVYQPQTGATFRYGVETDIRLAKSYPDYWQDQDCYPLSLLHSIDLEELVTHERGHSFGLQHVKHARTQTMFPFLGWCQRSKRTLGLGDMIGLEILY